MGQLHSRCVCSTPGVEEATLRIMLAEDGGAQATVGYLPPSVAIVPGMPPHHIVWPADPDFFGAAAHLNMAHEIGKATRLMAPARWKGELGLCMLTLLQDTWLALDTKTSAPMHAARSSLIVWLLADTTKRRRKSKPLARINLCSPRPCPSRRGCA